MRRLTGMFLTAFLMVFSCVTLAQSVVVTETKTWKSVPITVDSTANTYTVTGVIPTDTTNYYYTYSGYRCFTTKRDFTGINVTVLKAGVGGGTDIYCYPE